jgi:hypothetical protein
MSPLATDQVWPFDALPPTPGVAPTDTLALLTATMTYRATVADILGAAWPVGSVFTAVVATNPATLLGFGAWEAFGAGRVLVGHNAADTDFDTAEETGGAKTHTLTAAEMPAHTHGLTRFPTTTGGSSGFTADTSMSGTPTAVTQATASAGGDGAHNNMPPYIVVYLWKRTA